MHQSVSCLKAFHPPPVHLAEVRKWKLLPLVELSPSNNVGRDDASNGAYRA